MQLITNCLDKVRTWPVCSNTHFTPRADSPIAEVLRMGPLCDQGMLEATGFPVLAIVDTAEDSQFDALLRGFRDRSGLPPSAAAIALSGRKFHGQRGRPWQALEG
ncbi:MAG: hypothetical protein ACI97B_002433, partial [Verrucomicrobiales bacterium]